MTNEISFETDLEVGPSAIGAYSRLSYTMWHALAEFIDNSTQSRLNYGGIIDELLQREGTPLVVAINHDRLRRELRIKDNSIGMTRDRLVQAMRIAQPTKDSKGRSKYGMGMKTAACWIGRHWSVITTEWASDVEWTAEVDVEAVVRGGRITVSPRKVDTDSHGTEIVISGLHRNIQSRTEGTIRAYLGSMYRFDLLDGTLKILYNDVEVPPPEENAFDLDPHNQPMKRTLPDTVIDGKTVRGWVAVLRKGAGGRKYGGFSLFQNRRQIEGFPKAWKPKSIFGGVDDEGANNLVAQRLTGVIELDGFEVSHTKDAILYQNDEEDQLEKFLAEQTRDYRDYAATRRGDKTSNPFTREKVKELIEGLKKEFTTDEIKDAANDMLPPLETILSNNQKQVESLTDEEEAASIQVLPDLRIIVSLQERSENDPYLTIQTGARPGVLHVIVNNLHPYYGNVESPDAKEECLRQYLYDAIAEYRVHKQMDRVNSNSVRRKKDSLLRAKVINVENAASAIQDGEYEAIVRGDGA